jgi:hypothetical protein
MNAEQEILGETPRAALGIDVRPAGADTLAYVPATGRVHVLNTLAARVLLRADGATSVAEMVDDIIAVTGADRDRVSRDVLAVFADFRSRGLLS